MGDHDNFAEGVDIYHICAKSEVESVVSCWNKASCARHLFTVMQTGNSLTLPELRHLAIYLDSSTSQCNDDL